MRIKDSVWQGSFGYWQNQFIHQNILVIGYTAWLGYINAGRGMVVCEVVDTILPSIDWSIESVSFHQTFITQAQVAAYLQTLELEDNAAAALVGAIDRYEPTQAIVVLIIGNGELDINLLQNLAISPAKCYEQVQRQWVEFQPALTH
jgi:hypothetical protein